MNAALKSGEVDPLLWETQELARARNPDTSANFLAACDRIAGRMTIAAQPYRLRWKPRVAFYLASHNVLAHTTNLITYLRGLRLLDEMPIQPVVFCGDVESAAFATAFAGTPVMFFGPASIGMWRAVQDAGRRMNLDALVHVSTVHGLAFASAIRCARKHILWSMKWHSPFPNVDGYMEVAGPSHPPGREINGVRWVSAYCALPELRDAGKTAAARELRKRIGAKVVFGTFARDEKYSPLFVECVRRILERVPDSIFVYGSRRPIGDLPARTQWLNWVDTALWTQAIDVFLDTFPFAGGHVAYEAIAAEKPVVFMRVDDPEQHFPAQVMSQAGWPVLIAETTSAYVATAAMFARDEGNAAFWPRKAREFFDSHMRDEKRMAREVSDALTGFL